MKEKLKDTGTGLWNTRITETSKITKIFYRQVGEKCTKTKKKLMHRK